MSIISIDPESLRTWQEKDLEHLRYEYELKPESVVIDLGAYKGEWATEIHKRHGCQVVVVEPTEYINDFRNGVIVNKAAATYNGKMQFGGRAYYTSAFEDGDHEYECIDVNNLIEQHEPIDLLKLNIEGQEYDVLNHVIDAGLHLRIKNIQVQFHAIAGVPYDLWYKEISDKLNKTHSLTWHYPYCWENWKIKD